MKVDKFRFLIIITLVFSMFITPITFNPGSVANASSKSIINVNEKNEIQSISNLEIINESSDSLEYTYEQKGEFYKVEEYIKSDSKIESKIFKRNKKGNYLLESEKLTTINERQVKIETLEDNKTTIESFNLDDSEIKTSTQDLDKDSEIVVSSNPPLTGWIYSRTDRYSVKAIGLTVAVLAAILANRVVGALAKDFFTVASIVIAASLPNIYVSQSISFRYIQGTYLPRGERSVKTVYSNSARTNRVGNSVTTVYYTPGWP